MSRAVIVPLGFLSEHHDTAAVSHFREAGMDLFSMLWSIRPGGQLYEAIGSYRLGYVTTSEFRETIRSIFPKLKMTDSEFDAAWLSRLTHTEKAEQFLKLFSDLKAEGHEVILFSGTNELDFNHTSTHFAALGVDMPRAVLSFRAHGVGQDLLSLAKAQLVAEGFMPDEITLLLSPPEGPLAPDGLTCLNPAAWFTYLIEHSLFEAKARAYSVGREFAEKNGVHVFNWDEHAAFSDQAQLLTEQLKIEGIQDPSKNTEYGQEYDLVEWQSPLAEHDLMLHDLNLVS